MKLSTIIFFVLITGRSALCQDISNNFEPVPKESGFRMDGYWVWCGSVIKVDTLYHMFASRWPKDHMFPEDYRQNSEIVRATSLSPLGPYIFQEVVIGERDSSFWDSNMAHNPTIHKIGDEYVLFYIGSDFNSFLPDTKTLVRKIGYAVSKKISGPWIRSDKPIIDTESNNPAILVDEGKIKLLYRDQNLRVFLSEADNFKGPFRLVNDNVWAKDKIEDFYIFKMNNQVNLICEDNAGSISSHERWGVHLFSEDGISNWKKYEPVVFYDHDLVYNDNTVLHCIRRERPQLIIEGGEITLLLTAIFDGKNSWCQPVKLSVPIKVDQH